jgi:hypothetical protein
MSAGAAARRLGGSFLTKPILVKPAISSGIRADFKE